MIRFIDAPVLVEGRHTVDQTTLGERFRAQLDGLADADRIRQMVGFTYAQAGIRARHFELELVDPRSIGGWYLRVNHATESLAVRCLEQLFATSTDPSECDGLVLVSASHAGFPALSRRLQHRFGLPASAQCFDLTGLGCAGPTQGLQLADLLVKTGQCQRVVLVCVDAMGTHGESRVHEVVPSMSQLVAHCLASDAGAALCVSASPSPATLLGYHDCEFASRLWPDSLGDNDFGASADNQPYLAVGKGIRDRIATELEPLLATLDPVRTLVHPGGAALLRLLIEAVPELAPTLEVSREVLAAHGNVGAASLVWVLAEAHRRGRPLGPELALVALGPGIVATCLRLRGIEVGHG